MYAPVPHLSEHRFEIAHSLYFNVDDTDTKRRRNPVCGLKGWHNVGVLNMAKGGDAPTVSLSCSHRAAGERLATNPSATGSPLPAATTASAGRTA